MSTLVDDDGKSVPKSKRIIYVMHKEEAIDSRKDQSRGAVTLQQIHNLHLITKNSLKVTKRARRNNIGTTAGDVISNMGVPPRDGGWQLSFGEKKVLYGPVKRILPSGPEQQSARHAPTTSETQLIQMPACARPQRRDDPKSQKVP